jgi:hypothetical protein
MVFEDVFVIAASALVVEGTFCVECVERQITLPVPISVGGLSPSSGCSGEWLRRQSALHATKGGVHQQAQTTHRYFATSGGEAENASALPVDRTV